MQLGDNSVLLAGEIESQVQWEEASLLQTFTSGNSRMQDTQGCST